MNKICHQYIRSLPAACSQYSTTLPYATNMIDTNRQSFTNLQFACYAPRRFLPACYTSPPYAINALPMRYQ